MTPARTSAEPEAGAYLDRLIELLVFGRKPYADVPPYSTNEESAKLVVARLHRPPLRPLMIRNADGWSFDWRRPDPTSALQLAGLLQAPASACALVGDTRVDMETAVAAGMLPLGVLWGFRDRAELARSGARALAATPAELSALLGP